MMQIRGVEFRATYEISAIDTTVLQILCAASWADHIRLGNGRVVQCGNWFLELELADVIVDPEARSKTPLWVDPRKGFRSPKLYLTTRWCGCW